MYYSSSDNPQIPFSPSPPSPPPFVKATFYNYDHTSAVFLLRQGILSPIDTDDMSLNLLILPKGNRRPLGKLPASPWWRRRRWVSPLFCLLRHHLALNFTLAMLWISWAASAIVAGAWSWLMWIWSRSSWSKRIWLIDRGLYELM